MNILKEGDTKKVICSACHSIQSATFMLRDVPFDDDSGIVKDVLAGVCDNCDTVVVIPHQSTPLLKKQLAKQRKPVEVRVPSHMVDILNLASDQLGATPEFSQSMLKYYIDALSKNEISSNGLSKLLSSDLAKGKASKRISLKGQYVAEQTETIKAITDITSTTDLLKSVVLKINDDILVHRRANRIKALQSLAAATA